MKKLFLFFALFAVLTQQSEAQIFNKYKRSLNKVEKANEKAIQDGSDFTLDPIELVPVQQRSFAANAAQTNWGVQVLLPDDLKQQLAAAAKYPVTVKIYDTSGKTNHAALQAGQQPGSNYTTSSTLDDLQGHGTHVAGIMVGDGLGLLDPLVKKGLVKWKPVKMLSDSGSGDWDWEANAIATERASDVATINAGSFVVCNGSFGGGTGLVESVEAELKKSTDAGVIFCFAAGNTGGAGVNYPGNSKYSIACASLDENLMRSDYSTTGPEVWAAMPGRNINSTYKGNSYVYLSGTSMSVPFLTAAISISYSIWGPKLNGLAKMKAYLAWCANDITPTGKDDNTGYGIEYIRSILQNDPNNMPTTPGPTPPPPPTPAPPTREVRTLNFEMPKEYRIVWSIAGQSATDASFQPKVFRVSGKGSRKANTAAGIQVLTITAIEIECTGNKSTSEMYKDVTEGTNWFFTNRGLGLAIGADYGDATLYSAYFLEMLLKTQKGLETDIIRIEAKDDAGNTIVLDRDKLLPWPSK